MHRRSPSFRRVGWAWLAAAALAAGLGTGLNAALKPDGAEKPADAPSPAPAKASPKAQAMLDFVKALEGEWAGENGTSTFTVSSGGAVVRELMFAGTPHEMTNMYHLDGEKLICTHYCAIGNQPRMEAAELADGPALAFTFRDATNLASPKAMYMGGLKLTRTGPDTFEAAWTHFDQGKPGEPMTFKYTRAKPAK